ncbi:L-asparaginase [Danio aesculapii]|uniref:L-asparaginase n=1 Tax=Danio aesculapii TaxID=1142201 RepID=UPI0024BF956E|nr:L-asparaginase [Danio aesculapii]
MPNEIKACQTALFPYLLSSSAIEEDFLGFEEHLREGADISSCDDRRRTALHVAAAQGHIGAVRFLLQHGANVHAFDCNEETPLWDAIRCRSLEVVELLLSAGAVLEKSTEELGIQMCCLAYLGKSEEMEAWKAAGVSFNVADAHGRTPLHVAVCTDQPEMVKFCIHNGSDPELRDGFNNRPIDDAQRLGLQHMVELLTYQAHQPTSPGHRWMKSPE